MGRTVLYVLVGAVVLVGGFVAWTYNRLTRLRQNVAEAWSAIDTELKRRYDLVPNLVETVRAYAGHEKQTLEAVAQARNAAQADHGPAPSQAGHEDALTQQLRHLFLVSEAYPDLKASGQFLELQQQLAETETRIASARRFYNANVRELNTAVASFPTALLAAPFGFKPAEYFEVQGEQRFAAEVNFEERAPS